MRDNSVLAIRGWRPLLILLAISVAVALVVHLLGGSFEVVLGAGLALIALLDVFLTVLYARMGTSVLSQQVTREVWRLLKFMARPLGRKRAFLLSLGGPAVVSALVLIWATLLTLAAALIIHPKLGTSVARTGSQTNTDFVSALYAGGTSVAITGSSDFNPQTPAFRLLYLFNAVVGTSVTSLTITYLMQIYSALRRRNVVSVKAHLQSDESGDAAELLAGLGPQNHFSGGYADLSSFASDLSDIEETHHFYPSLFYFRFVQAEYSVSRVTLLALDTVSLIQSALDDERYTWLKESAAVMQLWHSSLILVTSLETAFLISKAGDQADLSEPESPPPDAAVQERWRQRYFAATRRLRQAGISTAADERAGADLYLTLRTRWDRQISRLAPALGFDMQDVDPAGSHPERTHVRPGLRRLRRLRRAAA